MRVNDVAHFTIADVLRQVDHKAALRVYAAQRASEERENPPIGTWKLDPAFGTFEVLVLVDPCAVEISEGDHEYARKISPHYRQWFAEGRVPPVITVVRHVRGYLNALNRRHVLPARDTNTPLIPAWFSETTPSGAARWKSHRHGTAYEAPAELFGWDYVVENY